MAEGKTAKMGVLGFLIPGYNFYKGVKDFQECKEEGFINYMKGEFSETGEVFSGAKEFLDPTDPDAGIVIKPIVDKNKEECAAENAVKGKKESFLIGGAGAAGLGLLGWKLGSNFGTLGKVAGGVIGVWAGAKFSKEIVADIASAIDYEKAAGKADGSEKFNVSRFVKTMGANLVTSGQKYDGKTKIESDPDPDVTD